DLRHLAPDFASLDVEDSQTAVLQDADLKILEKNDSVRMLYKREHVAGEELLPIRETHEEGSVEPGAYQQIWSVTEDSHECVLATQSCRGLGHRIDGISGGLVFFLDEMGDHLAVSLALEPVAARDEILLEREVVLDYSVVNYRDLLH